MFVTCYYDIYNKPERIQEYREWFDDLGQSGLPFLLFADPAMMSQFEGVYPSSVELVPLPLADCELYRMAMAYQGELPGNRSVEKDTKEFFALMNTKMELVYRAQQLHPEVSQFQWIDFGIMKIFKNRTRCLAKLREIQETVFEKLTIPGCWAFGRTFTVNAIHWRFCGGFFVMPAHAVVRFMDHSRNVLRDFCNMSIYKLTWETNVWTIIECCAEKDNIQWYFADHNDTMILNAPVAK